MSRVAAITVLSTFTVAGCSSLSWNPQQMFGSIQAQSGAFLITALHGRFERKKLETIRGISLFSYIFLEVPQEH